MANRYWVGGTATWDATAGTKWAATSGGAGGQTVPGTADTVYFDANSGANTITLGSGYNPSVFGMTMTGFTGTLAFGSQNITLNGNNATIWNQPTTMSVTGTPVVNCVYSGSTGTRTITGGTITEANSVSFNISAGSDTISCTAFYGKNLNFTGFTGTLANTGRFLYGSLTLGSGMTCTDGALGTTFIGTTVQQNITSNGVAFNAPITLLGTQTVQLQDALTLASARPFTLTTGTLDLNGKTLTTGIFSSANSNTRSVAFGTGNITLTGNNATILSMATATGFTYTGTPRINATYSGSTGTRTFTFGGTGASGTNCPSIYVSAGSDTVAFSISSNFLNVILTGFSGTISGFLINVYGNVTIPSGVTCSQSSASAINFQASSGTQLIDTNNILFNIGWAFSNGATRQLVSALNIGSGSTFTLNAGTIDLTNGGANNGTTLTCGIFSSSNSNTRGITFGTTGNITITGSGATVFNISTIANVTISGTPVVNFTYSGSTGTRTITSGGVPEAQAISMNISAGSDVIAFATGGTVKNIDFTGFSGTYTPSIGLSIYGNMTIPATMTVSSVAVAFNFVSASSAQTLKTNGVTLNCPVAIGLAGTTNTLRINGNVTIDSTHTLTLTSGTLDLTNNGAGNYTFTAGTLTSSVSNTRSIIFGTGNINLTGSGTTIVSMNNAGSFSYTGTPTVNLTYSGSVGTRQITFGGTAFDGESTTLNFNITAGSDTVGCQYYFKNLNFTGFTGTWQNGSSSVNCFGNLIVSSNMTVGSGAFAVNFISTTNTQLITSNGQTLDFPIVINAAGNTVQLQDALTVGSSRTYTLTNGTLDLNGKTLTTGIFNSNNSNTRSILFGTGNISLAATNTTIMSAGTVTGFSYTGTPSINIIGSGLSGETRYIIFGTVAGATESNTLNFNVTSGIDTISFTTNGSVKNLTFTGFTGTLNNTTRTIYGNLTLSSGMTLTAGTLATTFAATGTIQQITSNGQTMDFPLIFSGTNTYAFQDALTMGSTRTLTFSSGTLQFKTSTTNTVGTFATSGTTLKYLTSSTPGTQATISQSSGTVNATYLSVQDSNAAGGAVWNAPLTNNNINVANNTGWVFSPSSFFILFNIR